MTRGTAGVLLVLDGWGLAPPDFANAIDTANTPHLDLLGTRCPGALIDASGTAVGLLAGTVGNSEIGHMVIGAGRPVPYDSVLVHTEITSGGLRANKLLGDACDRLAGDNGALHLVGLCSDGQIHSDVGHLRELLLIAAEHAVRRVWIHAITDGRDVADHTAASYLDRLEKYAAEAGVGRVASVIGRGYAMDKSGNLEFSEDAVSAIADGIGLPVLVAHEALDSTKSGDEWIVPSVVITASGEPLGVVAAQDAVLFTNFRSDRIQQLADFLVEHLASRGARVLSLTQYDTKAPIPALVGRADSSGGLADELERHDLRSVRIAEAEKFEHVSYYVNGRDPRVRPGEQHVRITGDKPPDYRTRPQMNIDRVVEAIIDASRRPDVDLVVANLANIDVVGHTGDGAATVRAVEYTDDAVGRICAVASEAGRWVLLVGDHGNGEQMEIRDADGIARPYGGHTTNPVPLIFVSATDQHPRRQLPATGTLADIAPTVLGLLGYPPGRAMTGRPLL